MLYLNYQKGTRKQKVKQKKLKKGVDKPKTL
jgi:hypothetical protein